MSLRLKRLAAEYDRLVTAYRAHGRVRIRPERADPPERYEVDYLIKGLERLPTGELVSRSEHTIEIVLPAEYPRQPPMCKMKTPVFHPNIDVWTICTSDHWAAQETLVDLVVRIGQIIAFQSYNTKSPLNADAARWCDENSARLPVDASDLHPADPDAARQAINSALTSAELMMKAITSSARTEEVDQLLQQAHAVIAAMPEVPDDDVEFRTRRDTVVAEFERIQTGTRKIADWLQQNDAWLRGPEITASIIKRAADADAILQRFTALPAPSWMAGGSLGGGAVKNLHREILGCAAGLKECLAEARTAAALAVQGVPSLDVAAFPEHVRHLAVEAVQRSRAVPKHELVAAHQLGRKHLDAMSTVAQGLTTLYKMIADHRTIVHTGNRASELSGRLDGPWDVLDVTIKGETVRLSPGQELEVAHDSALRCRTKPPSGVLSLNDAQGRELAAFDSRDTAELGHAKLAVHARVAGLNSHKVLHELTDLMSRLPAEVHEQQLPGIAGHICPPWWGVIPRVTGPDSLSEVRASVEAATRAVALRAWVARQRTAISDLRAQMRAGASWFEHATRTRTHVQSIEKQLKEIGAHGDRDETGVVRLRQHDFEKYDRLYAELEAYKPHAEQGTQGLARVVQSTERVLAALEKGVTEFSDPSIEPDVRAAAADVAEAAKDALKKWSGFLQGR